MNQNPDEIAKAFLARAAAREKFATENDTITLVNKACDLIRIENRNTDINECRAYVDECIDELNDNELDYNDFLYGMGLFMYVALKAQSK